jgi:carbamoyl-phosphate synthase large subunit
MSIGRNFEEAIQKGLRMIGQGMHGFVGNKEIVIEDIEKELKEPTDTRIFTIAKAMSKGMGIDEIHHLTKIDNWFLNKLMNIIDIRTELLGYSTLHEVPDETILNAKKKGFSDFQIGRFVLKNNDISMDEAVILVRKERLKRNILPVVKQIDTLAGEFPAQTNYLYMTYCGSEHDIIPEKDNKSVVVLGSGAYRIGSSVEFDWCSVNAANTIRESGFRSIMINYNPETVSTDYDICDKLYFDELTFERVMDILDFEVPLGTIVSMGGQIPNNLAMRLFLQDYPILGTSPLSIDMAENRHKFSELLDKLEIDQPEWRELTNIEDIFIFASEVGYPLLVRPSYVLSGSAMNIVSNETELEKFLNLAASVSKQYPVVVSKFIEDSKEIEMDAVADNGEILAYAISEHVEFAGVHSGDATMLFPPQKVYVETTRRIKKITSQIARELNITGPFNLQYLAKDNDVKVIECNVRASRSFPFVSKVLKSNLIELATQAILGQKPEKPNKSLFDLDYIGVKAPQFSFSRLHSADPVIGVEMASTGEVGCLGENYYEAILSSMLAVGYTIPKKSILISSGPLRSKTELVNSVRLLLDKNYDIYTTGGTQEFLQNGGLETIRVFRPNEEGRPQILEMIEEKKFDLIINIPKDLTEAELEKDYLIRRSAIDGNIPLITNARLASAFIYAFSKIGIEDIAIKSWDEM